MGPLIIPFSAPKGSWNTKHGNAHSGMYDTFHNVPPFIWRSFLPLSAFSFQKSRQKLQENPPECGIQFLEKEAAFLRLTENNGTSLSVTRETTDERSLEPSACKLDELARILLPHRMLGETHAVGITGGIFPLQREAEVRGGAMAHNLMWLAWDWVFLYSEIRALSQF